MASVAMIYKFKNSTLSLIDKLKQRARQLKMESHVMMLAYRDNRTPLAAKILIGLTVGYLLSPVDLIPDFIPVLGLLDDLIIVPMLILLSVRLIPEIVLIDARQKMKDNIEIPKKSNWIFGGVIILIWLAVLYYLYKILLS